MKVTSHMEPCVWLLYSQRFLLRRMERDYKDVSETCGCNRIFKQINGMYELTEGFRFRFSEVKIEDCFKDLDVHVFVNENQTLT